jgi:hypothetical protein
MLGERALGHPHGDTYMDLNGVCNSRMAGEERRACTETEEVRGSSLRILSF